MPSPVIPDEFKATIPEANAKLCLKMLLALVRFPALFYKWFAWAFKADGTPSDEFKAELGLTIGEMLAPTGVSASDGTFTDKVQVAWNPSVGATYYEIWRGLTSDAAAATSIATVSSPVTTYADATAAANQRYYYFVKGRNATDSTGFSVGDQGFTDTTGGGGVGASGSRAFSNTGTWVVPLSVTVVEVEIWGAGGGGGGSGGAFCDASLPLYGGGGGGAGEYRHVKQMPVTAGNTLSIIVDGSGGAGGAGDNVSPGNGGNGGASTVSDGGTTLIRSMGGTGGHPGGCYATGTGGAGGTGGTSGAGADTGPSPEAGAAGSNGTQAFPVGVGGAGGIANNGQAAGGAGGAKASGTRGTGGRVVITWPGAA